MTILVIEDDKAIQNLIRTALELNDYKSIIAGSGEASLQSLLSYNPDVLLLDLGLPDMDGVNLIQKIRSWSNIPILVISARQEDQDKISALDAGADDYLTKPFSVDEMLARIRVIIRRVSLDHQQVDQKARLYENGKMLIDYAAGCAYIDQQEIHLTPNEYKLLCVLAKNSGKVLTHNYLCNAIWGNGYDVTSLRVFMTTLRKKIEKADPDHHYIQTHIGVGYRMVQVS